MTFSADDLDESNARQIEKAKQFYVRQCPHGYHHPHHQHSCDGCWCEGERDRREYGWPHNTDPREAQS